MVLFLQTFLQGDGVTFLSPNKKVTKEVGTGEGAELLAPASKAAIPLCTPTRPALTTPAHLNGQNLLSGQNFYSWQAVKRRLPCRLGRVLLPVGQGAYHCLENVGNGLCAVPL